MMKANKRKLTVNRLAMGNLRNRKKQYALMTVGILLAMIFSSGLLFFISCVQSSTEEAGRRSIGDFYGYIQPAEGIVDPVQGAEDGCIGRYGYAHIIGYAYTDEEKQDRGTSIAWLDEGAKELYYVTVKEGRYPEAPGEIALEADALVRLGIEPTVGEDISFSMLTPDGVGYLPDAHEKIYKLVGILADKRRNIEKIYPDAGTFVPAAFVSEGEDTAPGGKEITAFYYELVPQAFTETKIKAADGTEYTGTRFEYFHNDIWEKLSAVSNENYIYLAALNYNHIAALSLSGSDSTQINTWLWIVLAAVMIVASCIGIINAFTSNLQERRRQIGLLRAVGATRRQIISIFGREALIITLISAPVSVSISYFGVWLFAKLMGGSFIFLPDITVLIYTTLISVACVMAAALIPLMGASRISPMQAIRSIDLARKMKRKKIKQQRSFNAPALLAKRSVTFYRARQVGVSFILTLTILLSSFGSAIVSYWKLTSGWDDDANGDYLTTRQSGNPSSEIVNMPNIVKGITDNEVSDILASPLFSAVYGSKHCISHIMLDEYSTYMDIISLNRLTYGYSPTLLSDIDKLLTDPEADMDDLIDLWYSEEPDYYSEIKQRTNTQREMFRTAIFGFSTQLIRDNLNKFEIIDGDIDIDKLNSGEEVILVAPKEIGIFFPDANIARRGLYYSIWDLAEEIPSYFHNDGMKLFASASLDFKAGDTIDLRTLFSEDTEFSWDEQDRETFNDLTFEDKTVKIGAIIRPFYLSAQLSTTDYLGIVTTSQGMELITRHNTPYEKLSIWLKGENSDDTNASAMEYFDTIFSGSDFGIASGYEYDKSAEENRMSLMISIFSVVILFFAICSSIINNSLTTKIRASKREIGTLRAVGASVSELTSSYIRQLFSMFIWGCSLGFGGYIAGHFAIRLLSEGSVMLPFEIWQAAVIITLLFSICSLNLYLKIRKEMKNSVVENIREL